MLNLIYKNEKGFILPLGLVFLAIIVLLGTIAVIVTTTDLQIGGNYKISERAFYAAEAGIEEARARLRKNTANTINDAHPDSDNWRAYIGPDVKAQNKGWDNGNPMHVKVSSFQSDLEYVVEIRHQTDTYGNILYWGDPDSNGINERNTSVYSGNRNIYLVTSYGYSGASTKTIEAEIAGVPPVNVPAALYMESSAAVQGSSTNIIGTDGCGSDDKPGIVTTGSPGSIAFNGNPNVTGSGGSDPDVTYNGTNIDVLSLVNSLKGYADFAYTVNSATHTGTDIPGPGDGWGTPVLGATLQDPSSCSSNNIVYYNTQNTDIKLSGGVTGCGILIVDGDLDVNGGFSWHGLVITTGSVIYTGGGDKNLTGALISGGSLDADVIGGNSNIVYCSSAIDDQTENMPMFTLSWKEVM